jgi:7-alpha-hydroxysteroid dehydrogenase
MKKNELLNDLFSFEDRVIIITGGAGAIGSALAELLGNLGANIVITDINEERVKKVAAEIEEKTGNQTMGLVADSTDENAMKELVDKVVAKFGKISGLVNNVGWGAATPSMGVRYRKNGAILQVKYLKRLQFDKVLYAIS